MDGQDLKKISSKAFIYLSGDFFVIYIIKLFGHVLILAIAGQTAGPNWLKLFEETKTSKIDFQICLPKCFFYGQRQTLQQVVL